MKQLLCIAWVAVALAVFPGCGGSDPTSDESVEQTTQDLGTGHSTDLGNPPDFRCYSECQAWYETHCRGCTFYVDPCLDADMSC